MTKVKNKISAKKRHKKVIRATKGYVGALSKLYRIAHQQIMKSLYYGFCDRRKKKNKNKSIWITRINAAGRKFEAKYSKIINLIKKVTININRKMLCAIGLNHNMGFLNIIAKSLFKINCI